MNPDVNMIAAPITSIAQNPEHRTIFAGLYVQIQSKPMTGMALSVLPSKRTVRYPKSPLG